MTEKIVLKDQPEEFKKRVKKFHNKHNPRDTVIVEEYVTDEPCIRLTDQGRQALHKDD